MLRLGQSRQRRAVTVLAQVSGRQPSELALRHQPAGLGHAGVAEIGGIGKNGGEDRPRIVMRPPRRQMSEATSEAGPAIRIDGRCA